jgi:hypothetical protein
VVLIFKYSENRMMKVPDGKKNIGKRRDNDERK